MLRLRRWPRNLFVRWCVEGSDRCRRCGGRIRCRVRFLYLFRRGRRLFSLWAGGGGCARCRLRRCRRSRRRRPGDSFFSWGLGGGGEGRRTPLAGIPMPVSFFMYSARDFVLLFVTKTTCLPGRRVRASPLLGRRYSPLLRNVSSTSTVPSNKWSPDHKTPILLTSSAIVRASARKIVPAMVMTLGIGCHTYHRNRKERPTTSVSRSTYLIHKENVNGLTSKLSMKSFIPSLSPVRYFGWTAIMCY